MNSLAAWPDSVGHRWLDALRIPALPWARPLVGELGLPRSVAARPEPLAGIADRSAHRRAELQRELHSVAPFPGLDGGMTREVVIHAVHELAVAYSPQDAESFERWARLHVVEPDDVLWAWQLIFTRWLAQPNGAAPACVRGERAFLDARLGPDASAALQRQVRELAPEPTEEEVGLGSDVPREAGVLHEAIERERTLRCLRRLRERAPEDEEIDAIAAWGERLATALRLPGTLAQPSRLRAALHGDLERRPFESALELPIPQRPAPGDGDVTGPAPRFPR